MTPSLRMCIWRSSLALRAPSPPHICHTHCGGFSLVAWPGILMKPGHPPSVSSTMETAQVVEQAARTGLVLRAVVPLDSLDYPGYSQAGYKGMFVCASLSLSCARQQATHELWQELSLCARAADDRSVLRNTGGSKGFVSEGALVHVFAREPAGVWREHSGPGMHWNGCFPCVCMCCCALSCDSRALSPYSRRISWHVPASFAGELLAARESQAQGHLDRSHPIGSLAEEVTKHLKRAAGNKGSLVVDLRVSREQPGDAYHPRTYLLRHRLVATGSGAHEGECCSEQSGTQCTGDSPCVCVRVYHLLMYDIAERLRS